MKGLLAGHDLIALDTSVFIYHFEGHPLYRDLTAQILERIAAGHCHAVVSELTLLELIVRPLHLERHDVADEYEALLSHFPHLALVPITRLVVRRAASLRATQGFRTPDALLLATGIEQGATLMVTNDAQWKKAQGIKVVCLDDWR